MRWTQTLIPTEKAAPADAVIPSHRLMLRAGLIRQVMAGVYDYLPLAVRSLRKIGGLIREELEGIGAAEVLLPGLVPMELARGGEAGAEDEVFGLKDREGRAAGLATAHERLATELVGASVRSYKQLPVRLFGVRARFRDEKRARFGLMRLREFVVADAYSFHADAAGRERGYDELRGVCGRILARCGVRAELVEAAGAGAGQGAEEFVMPSDAGEDTIATSDRGGYAAHIDAARIGARPWRFDGGPSRAMEKVHTPGLAGIEEVAAFLKVQPRSVLKTLVHEVEGHGVISWLVAVVRGDHELNGAKLAAAAHERFGIESFAMVDSAAVRREWAIGFVGPDAAARNARAAMIVDPDAAQDELWVAGGNEVDQHVRNFNWRREVGAGLDEGGRLVVADIRNVCEGDASPLGDGGRLKLQRAFSLGAIRRYGTRVSQEMGAMFLDEHQQQHPMHLAGCGIGLARILVAAVETGHDERGIIWPASIAPYSVVMTPVQYQGQTREVAEKLYAELSGAGVEVLLDDRSELRPGAKFADADLVGIPIRLNIGERGLKEGKIEARMRRTGQVQAVGLAEVLTWVRDALRA